MKELYWIKWQCSNCGAGYPYDDNLPIAKGKKVEEYSKEVECPKCGCKGTIYSVGLAHEA